MKLIIAGSRTLNFGCDEIIKALSFYRIYAPHLTEIISGGAKGIDRAGEYYAKRITLPLKMFPADWDKHGKAAGHIRNKEMADYADALLLIWDGTSSGSKNMKEQMLKLNKPIYEIVLKKHNV